jgi:peroxiredoxin
METVTIGQKAPLFRLPAAQGGEVGLADYIGRSAVILWLTKGMACGFCRHQMSQLARGYARFRALGGELLQVTPTPLDRGRFYAKNFALPFPYLCDPRHEVFRAYGLGSRSHSPLWYLQVLSMSRRTPQPESDFGHVPVAIKEVPRLLSDDDMALFVLDRDAVVRYALRGSYGQADVSRKQFVPRGVPSTEEIASQLEALARA